MFSSRVTLLVFGLLSSSAQAATLYVSPTGTSSGTGTITSPFGSIQSAVNAATAGSTIYLRAGTYSPTTNIQITKSGSAGSTYVVSAYQNEKVIIDGEALTGTPTATGGSLANKDRGIFHIEDANFWEFYSIEFKNGPYGVYASTCVGRSSACLQMETALGSGTGMPVKVGRLEQKVVQPGGKWSNGGEDEPPQDQNRNRIENMKESIQDINEEEVMVTEQVMAHVEESHTREPASVLIAMVETSVRVFVVVVPRELKVGPRPRHVYGDTIMNITNT
ncbi:pectin lyase-like protein [Hymenopellis radicata]|nr:pectin lyase-like protein [Hymenopellis radicata]